MSIDGLQGYLRFLPALFAEGQGEDAKLARFLAGFEDLLTGRDDSPGSLALEQAERPAPEPIQARIARIAALFDPSRTPSGYVRWLSTWVGLDPQRFRSELVQRKATQRIVPLYGMRGTLPALRGMIELHIAELPDLSVIVDGGAALHSVVPAPVAAGVANVAPLNQPAGLLAPVSMVASDATGSWLLEELKSNAPSKKLVRVVRVRADDAVTSYAIDVKHPSGNDWDTPCALGRLPSGELLLLDAKLGLFKLTPPAATSATTSTTAQLVLGVQTGGLKIGSALAVSGTKVRVLEKPSGASAPRGSLATLDVSSPGAVTRSSLPTDVADVRSIYVTLDDDVLLVDIGVAAAAGGAIWRLSSDGTTVARVSPADGESAPLVRPVALAELDGRLYVLDAGMKPWGTWAPSTRSPSASLGSTILEITRDTASFGLTPICDRGVFAAPTALVAHGGRLLVADHGLQDEQEEASGIGASDWRADSTRLLALVFFTRGTTTVPEPVQDRALHELRLLVEQEKPAHVLARVGRLRN